MICEKCGAQLPENAKFCLECGNPISNLQPEEVKSVFDELQVEEVDSDSFFGQFSSSPVEEVKPPEIENNTNIVESVEDIPLQEEVVSDPFGFTPDVTPTPPPSEKVEEVVDTLPTPDKEIPINIPNPIPETPVSAAMPDLTVVDNGFEDNNFEENKIEVPQPAEPITTTVMNSGSVNQTTMSGITTPTPENEPVVTPNPNIVQMASNVDRTPDSVDDLLTDSTMNPPPLNSKDNSFAQPNFDQYSVNMMYGSNTEEEQYLRMQKEQLQPAKAFDKNTNPLPGAGSNVVSDFGNTYGNGLNNNTNVNAYQNNMQKNPQMQQQPMQRPQVNPYAGPKNPQPQQPQTFGSQLNQDSQMGQAPQATTTNVKDPTKKKSPAGKIIVVILLLVIIGALGYVFYPYIMDFINSKKNPSENVVPVTNTITENIVHTPVISNTNETDNATGNTLESDANQLLENALSSDNSVNSNSTTNSVANVINLDGGSTTANQIVLSNTTQN